MEFESYDTPWLLVGMKSDQRGSSEHKDIVSKEKAIKLAKDYGQYTYKVIFYKLKTFHFRSFWLLWA